MATINKTKAVEIISSTAGKFFTVTFLKKNGEKRTINGNCKKNCLDKLGYILVNDLQKKEKRKINTREIKQLVFNGITYNVK
jgi:hypothetical protein